MNRESLLEQKKALNNAVRVAQLSKAKNGTLSPETLDHVKSRRDELKQSLESEGIIDDEGDISPEHEELFNKQFKPSFDDAVRIIEAHERSLVEPQKLPTGYAVRNTEWGLRGEDNRFLNSKPSGNRHRFR